MEKRGIAINKDIPKERDGTYHVGVTVDLVAWSPQLGWLVELTKVANYILFYFLLKRKLRVHMGWDLRVLLEFRWFRNVVGSEMSKLMIHLNSTCSTWLVDGGERQNIIKGCVWFLFFHCDKIKALFVASRLVSTCMPIGFGLIIIINAHLIGDSSLASFFPTKEIAARSLIPFDSQHTNSRATAINNQWRGAVLFIKYIFKTFESNSFFSSFMDRCGRGQFHQIVHTLLETANVRAKSVSDPSKKCWN